MTATRPPSSDEPSVIRAVIGPRTVLTVTGEVDLAVAPDLEAAIECALGEGSEEVWVDLTPTTFMDSSGVHVLVKAHRRLDELNRRFAVICPAGPVRRLFEIAGALDYLSVFEDRSTVRSDL